jgi:hypothetical protein
MVGVACCKGFSIPMRMLSLATSTGDPTAATDREGMRAHTGATAVVATITLTLVRVVSPALPTTGRTRSFTRGKTE